MWLTCLRHSLVGCGFQCSLCGWAILLNGWQLDRAPRASGHEPEYDGQSSLPHSDTWAQSLVPRAWICVAGAVRDIAVRKGL